MKKVIVIIIALAFICSGVLYFTVSSSKASNKIPVDYYKGHTHVDGKTIGAPEHSGGTDSQGCHNASKPYHCH
ncbi:MAG: hypothetical protein DHS20C13_24210 [Thermodesulfobacteriota bacterium]|nr:MAG: hypothetical protein DHS20C13_24210 [Thermodesulfobacteriota bacterium]